MTKPGDKVGIISNASNGTVYFLGYGIYLMDQRPPKEIKGFNSGSPNPKLKLDSGEIVWGCEVWWGPEEKIKNMLKKYGNVVKISVQEFRSD